MDNRVDNPPSVPDIDAALALKTVLLKIVTTPGFIANVPTCHKAMVLDALRETDFYQYLAASADSDELTQRTLDLLKSFGFSDFLFTRLITGHQAVGKITSLPQGLLHAYYQPSYGQYDLLWPYLEENHAPTFQAFFNTFARTAPYATDSLQKHQELAELHDAYGYADAYILPLQSYDGWRCLLAIYSKGVAPEAFQRRVAPCRQRLELLGCAIDYLCTTRFASALEPHGGNNR